MSAIFKGKQGVVLVSEEPAFDAETGVLSFDQRWVGSKAAIFGFSQELKDANISSRVSNDGPVYSIVTRVPQNNPAVENLDRYEIATESVDKSIFEHKDVISAALDYNSTLSSGATTFNKAVEEAKDAQASFVSDSTFGKCVRLLRTGITGYERDLITLRRFRQIDLTFGAAGGKFHLGDDSPIYTTAQLQLPSNVAFVLPDTPEDPSSDFSWGWKRRGQRVEIVGAYVEQTVELLFAPWANLLYERADSNLSW